MRIKNNARNGLFISLGLIILALIILSIANNIPNVDEYEYTLNIENALKNNFGAHKEEMPTRKNSMLYDSRSVINYIVYR